MFEWPAPRQSLTDTGTADISTHYVCLHEIFGGKIVILDGNNQTHIVLSLRALNQMGYSITFNNRLGEILIHNSQNVLLSSTENLSNERPTLFFLDNTNFSLRQNPTTLYSLEPTPISPCANGDPLTSFDIRTNTSARPPIYTLEQEGTSSAGRQLLLVLQLLCATRKRVR